VAFDTELLELMPSTLLEKELVSFDRSGEPTYSTAVRSRYRCLVMEKAILTRNTMGVSVLTSHIAWCRSTGEPPLATSQYVLPDGSSPAFLNAEIYYDEHGRYGAVIYFGAEGGG
jgi:hypothetical protein